MSSDFRTLLLAYFDAIREQVVTNQGEWTVKGFIDIYQRIYTMTLDTKVLSKVLELVILPVVYRFAQENRYQLVPARAQNHYPDFTLISSDNEYYALDIKTTYRKGQDAQGHLKVNGMTLGTYTGYFRNRSGAITSTFPYQQYHQHFVLGVVYDQYSAIEEGRVYTLSELAQIPAVARNFDFFLHEKYRIASDRPGSGNTKNIGSTIFLERLLQGTGVFSELGSEIFDDYWMNYRNRQMAHEAGFASPAYTNLLEYKRYKEQGAAILAVPDVDLLSEANELTIDEAE